MKKQSIKFLLSIVLKAAFILLTALSSNSNSFFGDHSNILNPGDDLKKEALKILKAKCNVCHRKQNPFMLFNRRNMVRRAPKIYKMVFVDRRMPKGNQIRLTKEEYENLEKWLLTQNIN